MQRCMRTFLRRWLLTQPECASASEHQRGDAVDFVCREFKPGWLQALTASAGYVLIICAGLYLWDLLADRLALPRHAAKAGVVFIPFVALLVDWLVTSWLFRRHAVALLRQRLLWLGVPLCRQCGYDLRGQAVPRCPECGRAFDRGLLSAGPAKTDRLPPTDGCSP